MPAHVKLVPLPVMTPIPCPCGSGKSLASCCGPAHRESPPATTAEALMRARYTAYCLGLSDYLLATWHPSTRPTDLNLAEAPVPRWIGLTIRRHEITGPDRAEVEFIARYRIQGRAHRLHETSRFIREEARWFYLDGDIHPSPPA